MLPEIPCIICDNLFYRYSSDDILEAQLSENNTKDSCFFVCSRCCGGMDCTDCEKDFEKYLRREDT